MGATRKLQGEIDRVLKKVQEGVDVFDSTWNKVYDTENANQKEKFEADLKKEIKKLQRYRDQIKSWLQSSDIKDKKALLEARKKIEHEMERFKVFEKETKTKAFSKEGLGQQPKTDPKEKAKGESRDWLNNMVTELESQIDSCEAELESISVKKGKGRHPRWNHLTESISRHKLHIVKLELILRLLDNDELSPEQVNDVKDLVEDYVERNQDDFDEFTEVDDIYSSLPLDKMEASETMDAVPIVPPGIVGKEKAAVAALIGSSGPPGATGTSAKSSIVVPPLALIGSANPSSTVSQQVSSPRALDETFTPQDSGSDAGSSTPIHLVGSGSISSGSASPVTVSVAPGISVGASGRGFGTGNPSILTNSLSMKGQGRSSTNVSAQSSPVAISLSETKDEEGGSLLGRRVGFGVEDGRGAGRGSVSSGLGSSQPMSVAPVGINVSGLSGNAVGVSGGLGSAVLTAEIPRRSALPGDERLGSGILAQQLGSPLSSQNRSFGQTGGKLPDVTPVPDAEGGGIGNRVFSPPVIPSSQWRPSANSFQTSGEMGFNVRTEIAPDQKQKYLQRLQQFSSGSGNGNFHQQQHSAAILGASQQLSHLSGSSQKLQQVLASQQPTLLQQHPQMQLLHQQNPQSSPLSQPPGMMQLSGQGLVSTSVQQPVPPQVLQVQQPSQQTNSPTSTQISKEGDPTSSRVEEQQQQKLQDLPNDATAMNAALSRSSFRNEEMKDSFIAPGGPGTLTELSHSREVELTPGQHGLSNQSVSSSASGPGIIGRRSSTDIGAIGDNLSTQVALNTAIHEQLHNKQLLEASYHKIPLPEDSERSRNYVPRHPVVTPVSYPQTPIPIIENPAFWERLDTDALFFAFYYQQGTYQQYLAARELKKQSWRYHKKYNTWFQRHEEPKVTTDEFEQGTYVYFDFHIVHDDFQQGWCQRIKTEFTFEYRYLEDELPV